MRSILRATVFALLLPLVSGVARAQQTPVKISHTLIPLP